jgi:hypothetical protein
MPTLLKLCLQLGSPHTTTHRSQVSEMLLVVAFINSQTHLTAKTHSKLLLFRPLKMTF